MWCPGSTPRTSFWAWTATCSAAAPGWVRYAREFASRRNPTRTKAMSRVYAAEPSPTLLGSVADQRFVVGPQELHAAVVALGHSLLQGAPADAPGAPPWVKPVVADLQAHRGRAFIHAGPELSPESHALVLAMNEALGGRGATYDLLDPVLDQPEVISAELDRGADRGHAGGARLHAAGDRRQSGLHRARRSLDFARAMQRVKLSFALSKAPDETARLATWSVPMAHDWETWGDARGHDGTATVLQPMALPLYAGLSAAEVIARFLGETPGTDRETVQATWRASLGDERLRRRLAASAGRRRGAGHRARKGRCQAARVRARALSPPTPPGGALSLLFRPDPRLWDGRYANNPWLQELPEPLTKLTWDNPLLISPDLARRTGLRNGDKVNLRTGTGAISMPVWVQPGQAAKHGAGLARQRAARDRRRRHGDRLGRVSAHRRRRHGDDRTRRRQRRLLASTDHHTALFQVPGTVSDIVKHADLEKFQKNPSFPKELPEAGTLLAQAARPDGVGDVGRSQRLHRLQRLRHRLPGGEQRPDRRQGAGPEGARDALAAHRPLLRGHARRAGVVLPADALHALREGAMRAGLPGRRDGA